MAPNGGQIQRNGRKKWNEMTNDAKENNGNGNSNGNDNQNSRHLEHTLHIHQIAWTRFWLIFFSTSIHTFFGIWCYFLDILNNNPLMMERVSDFLFFLIFSFSFFWAADKRKRSRKRNQTLRVVWWFGWNQKVVIIIIIGAGKMKNSPNTQKKKKKEKCIMA